jgi:hypothetical protein
VVNDGGVPLDRFELRNDELEGVRSRYWQLTSNMIVEPES